MGDLGNCAVCGKDAAALYPLMSGSPAFCSEHHNPRDAGPFGCDFTGPDDFDIPDEGAPWEGMPFFFPEPVLTRKEFVWTDRGGGKHKLSDIDDRYLGNIINFLKKRKRIAEFKATIRALFEDIIEFLEKEAERRGMRIVKMAGEPESSPVEYPSSEIEDNTV